MRWFKRIIFGFLRPYKKDRESFHSFLFHETQNNPSLNLDDALNLYIRKHDLIIRASLDESATISVLRTKLNIMEDMLSTEPDFFQQE